MNGPRHDDEPAAHNDAASQAMAGRIQAALDALGWTYVHAAAAMDVPPWRARRACDGHGSMLDLRSLASALGITIADLTGDLDGRRIVCGRRPDGSRFCRVEPIPAGGPRGAANEAKRRLTR